MLGHPTDDLFRELSIRFEPCTGEGCAEDVTSYLEDLSFTFLIADGILNPAATASESSFTTDIVSFIYPFLP